VLQVIHHDPVPPSRLNASVPRDLETLCLKCLHKEPHLRYASAAALAEDLHRFLRGEAITARPERWLGRLARRVRRRPAFSAALAAGTLVLVGLAGGGLRLISERAAAAREAEAERAATERAAAEDLREMAGWLQKSSWPEARAALERAKGRLGDRGSAELRRRLDQGARDLDLAVRLDLARTVSRPTPDQADPYEEACRGAGLGRVGDDPEAVAARVRASNIANALVATLDHWSVITTDRLCRRWVLSVARRADPDPDPTGWRTRARDPAVRADKAALVEVVKTAQVADQPVTLLLALARDLAFDGPEQLAFLTRIQRAHPGDFWANRKLADVLVERHQPGEAIRYCQAAVASRPQIALGYQQLGSALMTAGRTEEAVEQFRRAVDIDPTAVFSHQLLALALFGLGRQDEAIEQLRVAIGLNPKASGLHTLLGHFLEATGRSAKALSHYRQAVALDPKGGHAQNRLRALLVQQGRAEEARVAWQRSLEANPPELDAWFGYAEFCLFVGQEDEYRRGRQALLAKFAATTNPLVAELTARACLLRPATGDELRQAVALAGRAAAEPSKYPWIYPHFLFAQGLAEYRQGRLDRAASLMRGEASRVLGPAPRLVLALAQHRSGQTAQARQTLAAAVLAHDWRASQVNDPNGWIFHVLRREAEALILPNLPACLDGKCQPQDKDERLALLGVCQFTNRSLALARLYTDAFAADPHLAEDLGAGHRLNAARAAALAGCGRGADAAGVGEGERARWRQQARQWLRADLAARGKAWDSTPEARIRARLALTGWRGHPDLAGVREPAALDKLSAEEHKEWLALWREVDALLSRPASR
jgi:serine/threonine-protein kinase